LALIEPPDQAAKRRTVVFYGNRPYGQLSDIRTKPYGFEFRTPSSFIVTPGISLGVLSLAKAVVLEELAGGEAAFTKLSAKERELLKFKPDDFYACKRDIFLPKLPLLENQFHKMQYFSKGNEGFDLWPAVCYLLKNVVEKGGYTNKTDIKIKWKLESEKSRKKGDANRNTLWREIADAHDGFWFDHPEEQNQEQFRLNVEQGEVPAQPPPRGWIWQVFDAETLWERLA
jgi:hypothetical protein